MPKEDSKKMEEVPDDSVALSQYDFEFHAYLMKMTHNELLIVMFNSIRKAYKSLTESIFAMGCLPTTINEHLAIVDAIADHDPVLAAHMMQLHLSNVESFRSRQPTVIREASENEPNKTYPLDWPYSLKMGSIARNLLLQHKAAIEGFSMCHP